jgi:nucleosome binding factor SPN SPT16 subunit
LYSEGPATLNWTNILDEIRRDFSKFLEEGAWAFLRDLEEDVDSEEERMEKAEDSDFEVKDGEGEVSEDWEGEESSDMPTEEIESEEEEEAEVDERVDKKKMAMQKKYQAALSKQRGRR